MDDHPQPPDNLIHFPDPVPPEDPYLARHHTPTRDEVPHDPAAEQALLGALLTDPTRLPDVQALIHADDLYRPEHELIYTAITTLANQGDPIDLITVADHLTRTRAHLDPSLRKVGGLAYLQTLSQACPIPANADHYATIVRDHARARAIETVATSLRQTATTADIHQLEQAFDAAYATLDAAAARWGTTTDTSSRPYRDLAWILNGEPPTQEPPAYTHRTDGHALFYRGKVNGVFGDPESGKTWLAQTAIVEALNTGGTAAMIDVDHNGPDHTAARLLLLGAHPTDLANPDRFRYYEPEDKDELLASVADITHWHPDVYVLDSLGEVLPMLDVKSVDNDEITTALRRTCTPPAAAGSCVITIDHLPKNPDSRQSGYAIGGTAKKRMMRGSYLRVEVRTQPAPGQIGRATIRIEKDTTGELRKHTPGGYAGTFILDSTTEHITRWSIEREQAPVSSDGHFRPTKYMELISRHVEQNDQATFRDIKESVPGKDAHLRTAIKLLIQEGFMTTIQGPRNSTLHHCISLYREAEDDQIQ